MTYVVKDIVRRY